MAVAVPNVAGVPAVAFAPVPSITGIVGALTSDIIGGFFGFTPQWGLFSSGGGSSAITARSVVALDYREEYTISDYPVERGSFESFDKVRLPFDVRFRFTAGSLAERQSLIESIDAIIGTTQLFDAVTPEKVFRDVNVVHQDFRRTAVAGLGLLQIDVWCLRVNQTDMSGSSTSDSSSTFQQPAHPSSSNPVGGGDRQASVATPAETTSAAASPVLSASGAYSP